MVKFVDPVISIIENARNFGAPGDWRSVTVPNPKLAFDTFVDDLRVLNEYVKEREEQIAPWLNRPPGFDEAIDELEAMREERSDIRGSGIRATASIPFLLARGRTLIDMMGSLIGPYVNFDPGLMAEWKAATKVRKVPKRAQAGEKVADKVATESVAELPATVIPESRLLPATTSPEPALAKILQPVRRAIRATATLSLTSGDAPAQSFPSRIAAQVRSLVNRVLPSSGKQKEE